MLRAYQPTKIQHFASVYNTPAKQPAPSMVSFSTLPASTKTPLPTPTITPSISDIYMKEMTSATDVFKQYSKGESVIESFQGSAIEDFKQQHIILQAIMLGLVFFILAHPKTQKLTERYISHCDILIIHMFIFSIIAYIIFRI